jgi:lysozyme
LNISEQGLELIRQHEGCRLEAYFDSVGVATIGWGHTRGVKLGDVCTQEQADAWLLEDVKEAEACIEANVLVLVPLTQGEFDALCSWVFNLGCRALKNSTLLRKLLASDYDGASLEILRWDNAGGKRVAGLTARREAERKRFEDTA